MSKKISIAQRLALEINIPDMVYAFVGGSVGRGNDDEWSDIDLTICVVNQRYHSNRNIIFEGEPVQLFITYPYEWKAVEANPLDYRFLLESLPVYDPEFVFSSLKEQISVYFRSSLGERRILTEWKNLVSLRQNWAKENLQAGKMQSATNAAGSAIADAAFMSLYFDRGSLSTGDIIPFLDNDSSIFTEYMTICYWLDNNENNINIFIRTVELYREHFRSKIPEHLNNFDLSPIQDILMGNKAKRLIRSKQFTNLKWQFSGEAFGLYRSMSQGITLEDHLCSLPNQLQEALRIVGFVGLSVKEVQRLIELSDEIKNRLRH